jgi:hypothetical protein
MTKTTIPGSCDFDDVAPDASAMIESMRAYGYSVPTAIADLIDNSIAAGASNVRLTFFWNGTESWIRITDDGSGMAEETLRNAMRLGSRNPTLEREPDDLGRFGLGLKTASLSQCRRLTVASRISGGRLSVRRWDLDHLAQESVSGWQLLKAAAPGSEELLELPDDESGTVVLWEILDRIVGDVSKDDPKVQKHFRRTIEGVEEHLAMVFHRYLSKRNELKIFINGNRVAAWDPFLERHPATQRTAEEPIRFPGHEAIVVRGFVLPHKDHLGEEAHAGASGPQGWNAQQGFYLYRNQRLIVAGSWLGLGSSRPWTQEEHYKLARIRLEIPNSMDHLWQLDVKKSSVQPPPQVSERLRGLAQTVRADARSVFAHRGKHRNRKKKEEVRRPWKAKTRSGLTYYQIDRQHPVIRSFLQDLDGERRQEMEAILRIVEETVPVQQIWLDMAEAPESTRAPFHGVTSKQRSELIAFAYHAIRRNRDCGHDDAVELLRNGEEFADEEAQAIISTLQDSMA